MRRFLELCRALEEGPRGERREAFERYLSDATAEDAWWASAWLGEGRPRRLVTPAELRRWAVELVCLPEWLVEECARTAGELAEAVGHLVAALPGERREEPLHRTAERLTAMEGAAEEARKGAVLAAWYELPAEQLPLWNRLVLGTFRTKLPALAALAVTEDPGAGVRNGVVDPSPPARLSIDAVLVYAQRGEGKLATHYSDYTFAVWHEGELVPIARTGAGVESAEVEEIDRWVRRHVVDRFGPVRRVVPRARQSPEYSA